MVMSTPTLSEVLLQLRTLETKVTAASAQKTTTAEKRGTSAIWGWVMGLIAAATIAIGAFFLLRKLKKRNQELAELRTKVEQNKIVRANLEHEVAIEEHAARTVELQVRAQALDTGIRAQERRISVVQSLNDDAMERVLQAQTWKELEALNDEDR